MTKGDRPQSPTTRTSSFGMRVSTMKRANTKAPMTMKNSMAVEYTASRNASSSAPSDRVRVAKPIAMAAKAETAAASVGENQPTSMPTTARKNRMASFHSESAARSRRASGIGGTYGAQSGLTRATAQAVNTYSTASSRPGMSAAANSLGSDCSATSA